MTALTNIAEDEFLDLLFTNQAWGKVGDAAGLLASTVAGVFGISLHDTLISDTTSSQTTNELTYTGYGRQSVARSLAGWTVTTGSCTNDAIIGGYGAMTAGGPVTVIHVGIGEKATGVGDLWIQGTTTDPDLVVNNGVDPQFAIAALDITAD